jgi:hypothetical protein
MMIRKKVKRISIKNKMFNSIKSAVFVKAGQNAFEWVFVQINPGM